MCAYYKLVGVESMHTQRLEGIYNRACIHITSQMLKNVVELQLAICGEEKLHNKGLPPEFQTHGCLGQQS